MVKSIILCLIWMAAGTAPTLTARDSSQIFAASKVWSLLEHSEIWPIIFMDSLQAAQRSVHFLAYSYSYSSNVLYKATTGRKMTERHFTGYVLLVSAVPWPDTVRACVPHPWCVLGFRDSSPVAPEPLLQALAQIQHHLPMLAFVLEA